jgi:hypothetical protein
MEQVWGQHWPTGRDAEAAHVVPALGAPLLAMDERGIWIADYVGLRFRAAGRVECRTISH